MSDDQEAKDFLLGKKKIGLLCKDNYNIIFIQRIENKFGTILRQKNAAKNLVKLLIAFDRSITISEHTTISPDGNIVVAFNLTFQTTDDRVMFVKRFNEYISFIEGAQP